VAILFLAMYGFLIKLPGQSEVKRIVDAGAIAGIVLKKLADGAIWRKSLSLSFLGSFVLPLVRPKKYCYKE
jgi:hypothetical protein